MWRLIEICFAVTHQVMKAHECYQLVFSSSCTVYGNPEKLPITEDSPIGNVTNVYGRTKFMIEEMLMDISRAEEVNELSFLSHAYVKAVTYAFISLRSVGTSSRFGTSTQLARILPVGSVKIPRNPTLTSCRTFLKLLWA